MVNAQLRDKAWSTISTTKTTESSPEVTDPDHDAGRSLMARPVGSASATSHCHSTELQTIQELWIAVVIPIGLLMVEPR